MDLITVDLKPFMEEGELERCGQEMADTFANNDCFAKDHKLVFEALKDFVNDLGILAESVEMTKQEAQAFADFLAACNFMDFDYYSDSGQLGSAARRFMDPEFMDEIAALNKYGKSLQMDIDIHDVDFV